MDSNLKNPKKPLTSLKKPLNILNKSLDRIVTLKEAWWTLQLPTEGLRTEVCQYSAQEAESVFHLRKSLKIP